MRRRVSRSGSVLNTLRANYLFHGLALIAHPPLLLFALKSLSPMLQTKLGKPLCGNGDPPSSPPY